MAEPEPSLHELPIIVPSGLRRISELIALAQEANQDFPQDLTETTEEDTSLSSTELLYADLPTERLQEITDRRLRRKDRFHIDPRLYFTEQERDEANIQRFPGIAESEPRIPYNLKGKQRAATESSERESEVISDYFIRIVFHPDPNETRELPANIIARDFDYNLRSTRDPHIKYEQTLILFGAQYDVKEPYSIHYAKGVNSRDDTGPE